MINVTNDEHLMLMLLPSKPGAIMPLITKIFEATQSGDLHQPFTVRDLKEWITRNNIVKDDGEIYAKSSINAILSNSDMKNRPTSNKNIKPLQSRITMEGIREYWF
jgi:hypothetical protein